MGSRWEVNGFVFLEESGYSYWECLYMGQSAIQALWVMFKNRKHYGCVKVELRSSSFL